MTLHHPSSLCGWLALTMGCQSDITVTETARCDGRLQTNEGEVVDAPFDLDGDGYFDANNLDCQDAYDPIALDCDDTDPDIHPGMAEVGCNGLDDDCNADTTDESDVDGDGFSACDDCDDYNESIHPGASEIACNNIDDDCNADTLDFEDEDEDGWNECEDCNDWDPTIHPDAKEEMCNGVDDDCNDQTPDAIDEDGDGVDACDDCDDTDELASPALEKFATTASTMTAMRKSMRNARWTTPVRGSWMIRPTIPVHGDWSASVWVN